MKRFVAVAAAALVGLLVGTAAWAVVETAFDRYATSKPALFVKGVYVGPDTGAKKVQADTLNKRTAVRGVSTFYDFPAVGGAGAKCQESWTVTSAGTKIGDSCLASSNLGVDGGAALSIDLDLGCRTITDGVIFRLCHHIDEVDAGTINLADAGFYGYVESIQAQ